MRELPEQDIAPLLPQLAGAVVGHGIFYYVAISSVLSVLCLSANTSFVDFPRVCRLVAQDDFLPRPFAVVGRRLAFSVGIVFLSVAAGILLIVFGGITDRLIPLFAVGVFLTFTMSQLGMVAHWRREIGGASSARERHRHCASLAINLSGTVITASSLAVIVVAKFAEGAWITIVVIPCVILLLLAVKRYYRGLDAQLRKDRPLDLRSMELPVVLVVTEGWNRLTDRSGAVQVPCGNPMARSAGALRRLEELRIAGSAAGPKPGYGSASLSTWQAMAITNTR
ncbi:MAG: APC family permease [Acetobacteraceae bacterium]|nr:APC family permease [Acetobacteraceae bacterium]